MNSKLKIICSDLDGTLLDDQKKLSLSNLQMIKRWQQAGNYFGISSGRQISGIQKVFEKKFQPDFQIGLNGAWVQNLSKKSCFYPISKEHLLFLANRLSELKIEQIVLTQNGQAMTVGLEQGKRMMLEGNETEKVSLIEDNKQEADKIFQLLKNLLLQITQSDYRYVEITEYGRTKVRGLIDAIGKNNLSQVAAIGDFYNDLGLIEAAGLGVAVENAVPEVKNKADLTVTDNNHSGVADLIERLSNGED